MNPKLQLNMNILVKWHEYFQKCDKENNEIYIINLYSIILCVTGIFNQRPQLCDQPKTLTL